MAAPSVASPHPIQRAQHTSQFMVTGRFSLTASHRSDDPQRFKVGNWFGSRGPSDTTSMSWLLAKRSYKVDVIEGLMKSWHSTMTSQAAMLGTSAGSSSC